MKTMRRQQWLGLGFLAAASVSLAAEAPSRAQACGGLFCSSANPVNQAAEQIIFADNHDGTTTAVIQILYEGPAHEFAWILPVPGTPEVGVSSEQAFAAIKQATNPLYTLQRTLGANCQNQFAFSGMSAAAGSSAPVPTEGPGVTIVDSGAVGPYVFETIMVNPELEDKAQVAIDWFSTNHYDIGEIGADVLRPYLDEGLNLIAFKLSKDSGVGAIRPIMLTYDSSVPSIPIRPTAVAANDDMGVMVFLLSDRRGIPKNYKALELNEALIDWFNPNNNYRDVVSKAADEAMGQGFVTEFAGPHANLGIQIFPQWQRDTWNAFQAAQHPDAFQMIDEASGNWGGYDGFVDALRDAVKLPSTTAFDDFRNCPRCFADDAEFSFDTTLFLRRLYELVIKPLIDTQALIDSQPYLTRLFTTMSAEDMTMDPLFDFNPDLSDVSNIHTATQVINCGSDHDAFAPNVPWKATLPQGSIVAGMGSGVWPISIESQPAALRILQYGTQGGGKVIEDRSDLIATMVEADNEDPSTPMVNEGMAMMSGGKAGSGAMAVASSGGSGSSSDSNPDDEGDEANASDDAVTRPPADDGCNASGARGRDALSLLLLAGLALLRRRRNR